MSYLGWSVDPTNLESNDDIPFTKNDYGGFDNGGKNSSMVGTLDFFSKELNKLHANSNTPYSIQLISIVIKTV